MKKRYVKLYESIRPSLHELMFFTPWIQNIMRENTETGRGYVQMVQWKNEIDNVSTNTENIVHGISVLNLFDIGCNYRQTLAKICIIKKLERKRKYEQNRRIDEIWQNRIIVQEKLISMTEKFWVTLEQKMNWTIKIPNTLKTWAIK